jgi:hypothetical protein
VNRRPDNIFRVRLKEIFDLSRRIRAGGFPVTVDPAGAVDGDGAVSTPLAVKVDGVTIIINGSNELESTVEALPGSPSHGDIVYRDTAAWALLPAGTAGHFLKTNGAGADPSWASTAGGGAGSVTTVRKTADETVNNSNTLQNDDHLFFTANANTTYQLDLYLMVQSASVTADWKWDLTLPSGTYYWANDADPANSGEGPGWGSRAAGTGSAAALSSGELTHGGGTNNPKGIHLMAILVIGGTGGTVQFRWAQNVATAEDNVLLTNSLLKATQF